MTAAKWQQAVAWELGLGGTVDFTPARVGQTLHLPCARGHLIDFYINARMPPEAVAKKLMQKGWTVGSKLLCPKHSKKSKAKPTPAAAREEPIMTQPESPQPGVLPPPPPVSVKAAPSDAAKAKRREALQWLSESFDVEKGVYSAGVSDASIAKETGLAENAVAQLREDFYGPLKEPNEIGEFRAALKGMREDISANGDTMRQAVRTLELRLEALCRKHNW